jgi:serine/threonine protein kinase
VWVVLRDDFDDDPRAMPRAGDILGQKYLLGSVLGEGGMGVVFEAVHLKLRQRVAVKLLHPQAIAMPDAVARFEREARATGRTRSPHVAHVLDVDTTDDGLPYLVMELLEGRDLEAELRDRGALPIAEAVDYALQACAAMSAAHAAGVVHRDLKPANLFLCEQVSREHAGRRVVKVLDFGISKVDHDARDASDTQARSAEGTPIYMSPEQVRSSEDVDGRSDIWSLGVMLFEMLAGAPPFLGTTTAAIAAIVADATPSLRALHPHVPVELERVIVRALAKRPEDRFASVDAFATALSPFASAEGLAGPFAYRPLLFAKRAASDAERARAVTHFGRARRSVALGAAAAMVAVSLGATILVSRSVDRTEPAAASAAALSPTYRTNGTDRTERRLAAPMRAQGRESPRTPSRGVAPSLRRPMDPRGVHHADAIDL